MLSPQKNALNFESRAQDNNTPGPATNSQTCPSDSNGTVGEPLAGKILLHSGKVKTVSMCLSLDFRMIFEFGRNSQRIPSQDPLRPTALSSSFLQLSASWTRPIFFKLKLRQNGKSLSPGSEMLIHTCNNLHYIPCTSMYSVIGVQQKLNPSLIWGAPDFCWSVWKHSISCQGCSPQLTDDSQDMIYQVMSQV